MLERSSNTELFEEAGVQITRRRRAASKRRRSVASRPAVVGLGAAAVVLAGGGATLASTAVFGENEVGTEYADGLQVSGNQIIKPLGERLVTQVGKFMGSTVSPDGRFLAATSTDRSVSLQIFDLQSYKLIWSAGTAASVNQRLTNNAVGQEGPTYSPNGKLLWMPVNNGLTRFPVNKDGTLGTPTAVSIPTASGRSALTGKAVYSPDKATLYAAVNGQNTVVALDPNTGAIQKTINVGIAPRDLTFVGKKLYVSNEGGRAARPGEITIPSYGTNVPADPYKGTSTTGTVSVIDTTDPAAAVKSIAVGLHPTALYSPEKGVLFVANTNDDTVSVIDTKKDKVVQTIETKPWPSSNIGYHPNSITMTEDGHLLVSLGRANAIAVYQYAGDPLEPVSYIGLIPTDYYPSDVAAVGDNIFVSNRRGIDARGPLLTFNNLGTPTAVGHGTHATTASLTRFTLPKDNKIANSYTKTVFAQNGWGTKDVQEAKPKAAAPVPVPERIGDPSTIKHVFLIVKENRTYDQVYGDMPEGNGDASLAQFGERVTPNQHALARQFGLYDNVYDIGTNSAEGHNWIMQGDDPEYTESSAGQYTRSYDTQEDVLGHQRSGFIWTAVQDAGKTARNFGEFVYASSGKPAGTWQQYYCATKNSAATGDYSQLTTPALTGHYGSPIPSLNAITNPTSPPYDLSIPDIYRAAIWKQDFLANGPANFNMMWLSSDHTGGPPDPTAEVADGDLAVGQIVDTISHSQYWKESVIFVVEDDSQSGADHVDGHRAPIQVISPWAAHGKVDSTFYSQINMVRTIEQILGAQPLNQKVAAAMPMYSAFTNTPDMTPFNVVQNQVPITTGVNPVPPCGPDTLGQSAAPAAEAVTVPAEQAATAAAWASWAGKQRLTGANARADYANPEQMNRYTWYETHDWLLPYPGDSKIYAPDDVPGAFIPNADTD